MTFISEAVAAGLAAHYVNGFAARDLIKPGAEDGAGRKLARVLGELEEGGLSDFLGQLRRAHLPQRGGMDEVEVPTDEFRKGVLGMMPRVTGEQFPIGVAHVQKDNVPGRGNPPNFLATGEGTLTRMLTSGDPKAFMCVIQRASARQPGLTMIVAADLLGIIVLSRPQRHSTTRRRLSTDESRRPRRPLSNV
jgi:hypothetical protein